jgi:hypothetical protein
VKKAKRVPATRLTLEHCRKMGARTLQTVEHRNPHTNTTVDLFGFIDVLVVVPNTGILGIQATSTPNITSRIKKACDEDHIDALRDWLAAGGAFEVWGWDKREGKDARGARRMLWTLRREQITLEHVGGPQ